MRMRVQKAPRKQQLKAALALAGITLTQFAADNGVTYSHLYAVLNGERESQKLTAAIDAFVARHAPKIAAA